MSDVYPAKDWSLDEVLGDRRWRLVIPAYQRTYVWGQDDIADLLSDLVGDFSWVTAPGKGVSVPHFLGTIVALEKGGIESDPGPKTRVILDGQQRITTLTLMFWVLRRLLASSESQKAREWGDDLRGIFYFGPLGSMETKLFLQGKDAIAYQAIATNTIDNLPARLQKSRIVRAYKSISTELEKKINKAIADGLDKDECLIALTERLTQHTYVVLMATRKLSRAFQLFKTMNDRGADLNAADLIKNEILSKTGGDSVEHPTFKAALAEWDKLLEILRGEDLVQFFRYFWISEKKFVRVDELFDEYERHLKTLTPDQVLDFSRFLVNCAEQYVEIVKVSGTETATKRSLHRLVMYRARTYRALLMRARRHHLDSFDRLVTVIESSIVRSLVLGGANPNEFEKAFSDCCAKSRDDSGVDIVAHYIDKIRNVVPDDVRFIQNIETFRVERTDSQLRAVLSRLNEIARGAAGGMDVYGPKAVHIEHIYPEEPHIEWRNQSDVPWVVDDDPVSVDEHADWVSRIGNFTLLERDANESIQNRGFAVKCDGVAEGLGLGYKSSDIRTTRDISVDYNAWGQQQISEQTRRYAQLAVVAWPWPN